VLVVSSADFRLWQIVLKKLFLADEQKFGGPLMRRSAANSSSRKKIG
jgi:hypothetical protein